MIKYEREDAIKARMKKVGVTQRELSIMMGITEGALHKKLNGNTRLSVAERDFVERYLSEKEVNTKS